MGIIKDLTGQKFGRLLVLEKDERIKYGNYYKITWKCICDCGKECTAVGDSIKRGLTQSCGCFAHEQKNKQKYHLIHGDTGTRIFRIWCGIRDRCKNTNNPRARDYVGRGITVCEEWSDYLIFKHWAMLHGYREDLTIDRIDNLGNYCPENCRWVTTKTQNCNTRRTKNVTFNGKTQPIKYWAIEFGISYSTLIRNVNRYGFEKAIEICTAKRNKQRR